MGPLWLADTNHSLIVGSQRIVEPIRLNSTVRDNQGRVGTLGVKEKSVEIERVPNGVAVQRTSVWNVGKAKVVYSSDGLSRGTARMAM